MIEESYVSFDTAKLLKEAGFEANLKTMYVEEEKDEWAFWDSGAKRSDYNYFDDTIACPTQALAARWLREAHGIHVCIDVNASGWYYDLCKSDNGTHILWSSYQGPNDGGEWDSYEEALEAGLKICLELIKKQGL